MKILFVIDSLGTGGAERSTAEIWYYLRSQGIKFSIIAVKHRKEGIEQEILNEGFNVVFLKKKGILAQSREISEYIKAERPDIVHSVLFMSNLRVRFARMVCKFRYVESLINCTYDPVRLKDPRVGVAAFNYYKLLDKSTSFLVDHFLAITHTVKTHYENVLKIPKNKISVIYRSRQPNKYVTEKAFLRKKLCRELGLTEDTLLLLHVGRQEFQKGHLVLLGALSRLSKSNMPPCAFVFVGREGNMTPDIRKFLSENTFPFRIFWLGHRYDVGEILAAADIFVFPSLYEGLGGALIEAQAAALPIICSDLPVLKEVVLENRNALMFKSGNEQQLADLLADLIQDKDRWERMRAESLENYKAKFFPDTINSKTTAFYQDILENQEIKIS